MAWLDMQLFWYVMCFTNNHLLFNPKPEAWSLKPVDFPENGGHLSGDPAAWTLIESAEENANSSVVQNKSWLKLMPRAGLSAACHRVTHQNNPDSLIMYGLMCGSLPGTNNGQTAGTSFATLCVLYMRVWNVCVSLARSLSRSLSLCVWKDLCKNIRLPPAPLWITGHSIQNMQATRFLWIFSITPRWVV